MVLGLGGIFYVSLLLVNAIAILNEERFLARGAPSVSLWSCTNFVHAGLR